MSAHGSALAHAHGIRPVPSPEQKKEVDMASNRWCRTLIWLAVLAALAIVTASYFQPALVVDLGNRLWSCF